MRSKLFVPGIRTDLFAKAVASPADAISFDLEDSVIDSRKAEARTNVAAFLKSSFLKSSGAAGRGKTIIVRSNALDTADFEADILGVMQPSLDMINLPKVQSAEDICTAVEIIERAEKANDVTRPVGILATIESPRGLRLAAEIAAAHPRVTGLQLGLNDLFETLAIDRRDANNIHTALFAMRLAAGEAGIFAYDGAYTDMGDQRGFRAEAEMAHRLGYMGKSCIHPCQILPANEVFSPSEEEIAFALQVLKKSRSAAADGVGVFMVDGKMIDLPIIRRAEAVIAMSKHMPEDRHHDTAD